MPYKIGEISKGSTNVFNIPIVNGKKTATVDGAAVGIAQESPLGEVTLSSTPAKNANVEIRIDDMNIDFGSASKTLDPRITFSRTSNATLTGSNGLIQYAPHNLLTYSEQFDNAAWTKAASTVSANVAIAPDGTTTADKLVESAILASHYVYQPFTSVGATYAYTIYAKAAERRRIALWEGTTSANGAVFDLVSGTVVNNLASGVGSITSIGNGWYRCTVVSTETAGTRWYVCSVLQDNGTSVVGYTGDGVSGVYIWGSQTNIGAAQSYNPTTVKNLLGYTQEFDNAAWTKSNSFVQTNLLTYSQDFDNAAWSKAAATVNANAVAAPNGTTTADSITASSANGGVYQGVSVTAGVVYTWSVYAKAGTGSSFRIKAQATATVAQFVFDLTAVTATLTAGAGTATITYVGDGWYRCTVTATATLAGTGYHEIDITNSGETLYLWGAQLVQGSSAGNYTATYSAAKAVMYPAPDGSMSADKLVESATTAQHYASVTPVTTSIPYVLSVYAKAAERTQLCMVAFGSPTVVTYFDLSAGTIISGSGTITSTGNGWYRCSIALTGGAASTNCAFFTASAGSNSYTGDGTSGIYIWGAQLSDSASVDPYVYNPVAAPSAAAYYGPRFDYDPITLAPKGLLIEEQRTNLLTYSEQFDNAAWNKGSGSTVAANVTTAPNATSTADAVYEVANTGVHYVSNASGISLVAGTWTFSEYIKSNGRQWCKLTIQDASDLGAYFDVVNGVIGTSDAGVTATIAPVGNGWFRCSVTRTLATTATSYANHYGASANGTIVYAGDTTKGAYIWGAQLEAGAFATSYIPTVASQVTRAADNASMIGANFSNWYNVNEGGFFVDVILPSTSLFDNYSLRITGASSLIIGYKDTGTTVRPITGVVAGGGVSSTAAFKASGTYSFIANEKIGAVNGTLSSLTTTGAFGQNTAMEIGGFSATAGKLNGWIKRIAYYPRRLSNSELQSITASRPIVTTADN